MAKMVIAYAAFVACGGALLQANDPEFWRYWTARDGLQETYSLRLSTAPDDSTWIRHGAVRMMSVLDGYSVRKLPEPREASRPNYQATARVYGNLTGAAWTAEEGVLKQFSGGRWVPHHSPLSDNQIIAAIPMGQRVLVVTRDSLLEYDAASDHWQIVKTGRDLKISPFLGVAQGSLRDIWLTGELGLGHLEIGDGGRYQWKEVRGKAVGIQHFDRPLASGSAELFAQGLVGKTGRRVLVRWTGAEIKTVYSKKTPDQCSAWRGPDGAIWILEGGSLFRMAAGRKEPVQRPGVLSGSILDVFTDARTFWVATSEGVARYTRPLWREPAGLTDMELPVHAAVQDRKGRLWFAATDYLLSMEGDAWKRHALPTGLRTHMVQTQGLVPLDDGRILIMAINPDQLEIALLFDPERGSFSYLHPAEGRRVILIAPRGAGGAWVATARAGAPGFRLEVLNGGGLQTTLNVSSWKGADLRMILERPGGELWFGGTAGGCAFRKGGFFDPFEAALGYNESGVYTLGELPSGEIIAGGRDKLLKFDGRAWTPVRNGLDRMRNSVTAPDGTVWLASASGIHRWKDNRWITNGVEEGLPSVIGCVIFRDRLGRFWAGTSRGLRLYDGGGGGPGSTANHPGSWQ